MAEHVELDIVATPGFEILSNFERGYGFWTSEGVPPLRRWWPSAEHYFQAGKFNDFELQEKIRLEVDPGIAKHLGRTCSPLRPDWDRTKHARLKQALLEKFWAHPSARAVLQSIPESTRIVFGSAVDSFFGVGPDGHGQNIMGAELQNLRTFFSCYPRRRQVLVTVGDIGEPFEPRSLYVDVTGVNPTDVLGLASVALGIAPDRVEDLDFVYDDGFERCSVSDFDSADRMEHFLAEQREDFKLEVRVLNAGIITLWNGTDDSYLARADVSELSCTLVSIRKRLEALLPLLIYQEFNPRVTFSVDGSPEQLLSEHSMQILQKSATEGADVIVSGHYDIPTDTNQCRPLIQIPRDLEHPAVLPVHSELSASELIDKIRGVIWGAALGDAVGLSTEFMEKSEAARAYPEPQGLSPASRIEDRHRKRWDPGDWTDDTDQMILLLDALIEGRGLLSTVGFAKALKRWRNSGFPELGDSSGLGVGQTVNAVLEHPAFLTAPDIAADVTWRQTGCSLAANGAIMRCAAAGLFCFWNERLVKYNAAASASVTHADPRCLSSCICIALLLANILVGHGISGADQRRELAVSIALQASHFLEGGDVDELLRYVDVALDGLEHLELSSGGIGYTYKPLGAAMWAFIHCDDFKAAVQAITMEAGDADSNATVAGALLGARLGFSQLPQDWLNELPQLQTEWLREKLQNCFQVMGLEP
eukprot:Skav228249  [mRNA]  locus=scaffold3112:219765:221879:+ [translate_table: standard]